MNGEPPLDARVLNLARGIAGAYATRLLADLGARCSWWRWQEPRAGDWPPSDLLRAHFEAGVELRDEPLDREALLDALPRLAPRFDLVIADFALPELEPGALFARLRPTNPAAVAANADHFGREGPYARWAGDELTDYALGGYWSIAGDPSREPLRVPGHQAQFHAGLQLAFASLAALRHARRTGEGQELEVSAAEAMLGAHWSTTVAWTHEGRVFLRGGSDLVRARDGWVHFFSLFFHREVLVLIERPDLAADERLATIAGRSERRAEIEAIAREWCAARTVGEIVEKAQALRVPAAPMADAPMLLADPQLAERGWFREVDGRAMPGRPGRWSDPWPDADAPDTLARALADPPPPAVAPPPLLAPARAAEPSPLAGLRVIEVTNNWAGPLACRHLADLGAEVIKVELATKPATRGSHYPGLDPGPRHWNRSGYFNEINRNKRDVALNLATDRGRALFLELAGLADVVVENNSARVMPNLGLGWERLREVNPRLVMVSISGFGATGPRRDWIAYGSNIEAACGLAAVTGYADDERPYRTGSFVADPIAGAHAAMAAIAGLERLARTGRGSRVDLALTEAAMTFMAAAFAHAHEHGAPMPRRGNAEPDAAPAGAYPAAGRDDWIAVAVRTDGQWRALCALAGMDDLAPLDAPARVARRAELDERLAAWTRPRTRFEAVAALQDAGVPAASILHNWQLHADPHFHARGSFVHIDHPDTGVYPYPGFMWRFSLTPPAVRSAAPRFAEGNDYVFGRLLGLDADAIERLYAEGVSAREPAMPAPPFVPAPLTTP